MPATPKGKKMRAFRVALAIASALMFSRVVQGQSCDVPPNGVLVNDQYLPDPAGRYWLFDNWRDDSGDGRLRFGQGDYFNFRDHLNQPVRMSDPGVLSATYNGETWYYVSGSSSTFDYANVAIYRTRDFRTFDLHMLAFDESNQNGSGQSRTGNVLTADGRTYFQVWGPNFWIDQGANDLEPVVHMVFVAIENYIPTPADYPQGFHSIYQASIPLSAFQSWHSLAEPLTNDGPRFNDPRLPHQIRWWFGYLDPLSGNLKYDGGLSAGIPIATTVSRVHEGPNCGQVGLRVWGKYHHCVGGVQGMTAMFIDPFVFVDEAQPENGTWRRTLFYSWHDHDPAIPYDQYGEYLAAVPLSPGSYRVRNNTSVVPLAYSRNSNNQLFGLRHDGVIGFFDNGAGDIAGRETLFTAVAEGPCAFRRVIRPGDAVDPAPPCFLIYTRNFWSSSYYQIVARRSDALEVSSGFALADWKDKTVSERVILRSANYNDPTGNARSYGHPDVFKMLDPHTGKYTYYLAVHVKVDGGTGQTMFFKELSFDESGDIIQLQDGGPNPVTNVLKFRIPATGICCGLDFDGSGVVDVPDIFSFLTHFYAANPDGDFDRNGIVEVPDIFAFLSRWYACTGS